MVKIYMKSYSISFQKMTKRLLSLIMSMFDSYNNRFLRKCFKKYLPISKWWTKSFFVKVFPKHSEQPGSGSDFYGRSIRKWVPVSKEILRWKKPDFQKYSMKWFKIYFLIWMKLFLFKTKYMSLFRCKEFVLCNIFRLIFQSFLILKKAQKCKKENEFMYY